MSHEAISNFSNNIRFPVDQNQLKIPLAQTDTGPTILHDLESMPGAEKTVLTFSTFQNEISENEDEEIDFRAFGSPVTTDFASACFDLEEDDASIDSDLINIGHQVINEGVTSEKTKLQDREQVTVNSEAVKEKLSENSQREMETRRDIELYTAEVKNVCNDYCMPDKKTPFFDHIHNTLVIGVLLYGNDNGSAKEKILDHVYEEIDHRFAEGTLLKRGADGELRPMTAEDVAELKQNLEKSLRSYISSHVDLHQIKQSQIKPESGNGEGKETKLNNQQVKSEEHVIRGGRIADITPQKVVDAMVFIGTFPSFKRLASLEQQMLIHMKLAKAKEEVDNARNVQKLKRIEHAELEKEIVKDEIKKDEIKKMLIKSDTLKHEMESKKETYGEEYAQVFFNVCGLVKEMISEGLVKRVV